MRVSVAYALPEQQWWLDVEMPEGATVVSTLHASGLLELVPDINLEHQKVGVFGRFVTLESSLVEGDRVEVYRPITWQPDDEDDDDDF
jgi:putative ubiquitin-RnfH superfamily antitoxin RatB of RatAB toxin-antitoxin module